MGVLGTLLGAPMCGGVVPRDPMGHRKWATLG